MSASPAPPPDTAPSAATGLRLGWLGVPRLAWPLYGVLILAQMGVGVIGPILPSIQSEFDLTFGAAAQIISAMAAVRLFIDLPAGYLVSRFSRRGTLGGGVVLAVLSSVVGATASDLPALLLSRALLGCATALIHTSVITWLSDVAESHNRGLVMSLIEASFVTAGVLSPTIGGILARTFEWRMAYWFTATTAALALLLLVARRGREEKAIPGGEKAVSPPNLWVVLGGGGIPLVGVYLLTLLVFFYRNGMSGTFGPLFGGSTLGLDPATIGFALSLAWLCNLAATIGGGALADRVGRVRLVLPGLLLMIAASLAFFFVGDLAGFILGLSFVALTGLLNGVPTALLAELVPTEQRGMATGVYRVVADIGFLSAPLAVGAAMDLGGPHAAIVLTTLIVALSTPLILIPLSRKK